VIAAALLAAGLGAGVLLLLRGWYPAPRPLAELAAELRQPRAHAGHSEELRSGWRRLALRLAGDPSPRQLADLAVTDRTRQQHSLDKIGYAIVFGALGAVPALALPATGVALPPLIGLAAVAALAAAGFLYPDMELRSTAHQARKAWSHALATFLDVVSISLAGGAGVEDAVIDAATAGTGPQLTRLAASLHRSQARRQSLWTDLERLGREADIIALRELAAAMELASQSGSRIRETLSAKAAALRIRQLTEVEAEAQRASETMGIAPALMAVSAVLLIGYPAVATFLNT
jgi:tight adherence protein C